MSHRPDEGAGKPRTWRISPRGAAVPDRCGAVLVKAPGRTRTCDLGTIQNDRGARRQQRGRILTGRPDRYRPGSGTSRTYRRSAAVAVARLVAVGVADAGQQEHVGSPPSVDGHQVPGLGGGHPVTGNAAAIAAISVRSAVSRAISASTSASRRRRSCSAGSQGQAPVSRTASRCRMSTRRSPSRCAPRMNRRRSIAAAS
jgi:hypothetical protein